MKRLPSGSLVLIAVLAAGTTRAGDVYFERDVRPILKAHCFHCHGEAGEKEGNLDVRLVRFMTAGGDSGAAIEPATPTPACSTNGCTAARCRPKRTSDSRTRN